MRRRAFIVAILSFPVSVLLAIVAIETGRPVAPTWSLTLVPAFGLYAWQTSKIRRRRTILNEAFPAEWEAVLQRNVAFFRVLDPEAQERFRRQLQVFLGEKRITGIQTRLDTTTRILTAASAVIPIFGFPDWEWDTINEILIYPNRFDGKFKFGDQ